jgi:hypothetical protein
VLVVILCSVTWDLNINVSIFESGWSKISGCEVLRLGEVAGQGNLKAAVGSIYTQNFDALVSACPINRCFSRFVPATPPHFTAAGISANGAER